MIADLLRSLRPHQWVKNSFLFAGALFGHYVGAPVGIIDLGYVCLAFLSFCLLSGGVYVINDVADRKRDREHPLKCHRPIASGRVSVSAALAFAAVCLFCAILLAWAVSYRTPFAASRPYFLGAAAAYLGLNLAYTFALKNIVILDVLAIALGFVLRVAAGCLAIPVVISPWILACTLLLALFLGLCKRRHELILIGEESGSTRKVLPQYSVALLDQLIAQTAAAVIVAYLLYTFQPHGMRADADGKLMLTAPFVIYGVWRYQYLAYRKDLGGSPEKAFTDISFLVNGILWVITVLLLTGLD